MIRDLLTVWRKIPKEERGHSAPFVGLNFIASDGKSLAAHCLYEGNKSKSLCGQGRPFFEMCYNVSPDELIVASEPLDRKRVWKRLKRGQILVVEMKGG